jgi:hypothetical protein
MWSDSLFPIPEYINEFELRHYCFGEGDSSGGNTSDEEQMPHMQFAPDPAPAMDDANNPNSPSAGYVGGEMPSPESFGYSRGYDPETDSLMPVFDSTRADSEFERGKLEEYERVNRGFPIGLVGALLAPFTFGMSLAPSVVTSGFGMLADKALGTEATVSNALGLTTSELAEVDDENALANFFGIDTPAETEADEARSEIASNTDDDMISLEGPSILTPVAPVSAMQRVPNAQQQIAQALLQPSQPIQGRPGYTRANTRGPIYFT